MRESQREAPVNEAEVCEDDSSETTYRKETIATSLNLQTMKEAAIS